MKLGSGNYPGGYRHFGYSPRHPWGEGDFIQWGKCARGFFVEANTPDTYLRGEAATIGEAEDKVWAQHQRELACPGHRWSPMQPGMGERFDGYGVCLECRRHQSDVLPVRTVCNRCGVTVKLYSTALCEPCYDACDDAELERREGITSVETRTRMRQLADYEAVTPEPERAAAFAEALACVIGTLTERAS